MQSNKALFLPADIVRHQCFVVRIHGRIISAIDSFPGDQVLQETAIEALAVLGGAGMCQQRAHTPFMILFLVL